MILVTTPTGDIGSRVLSRLVTAGAEVRVILRDPSKLPHDLRGKVQVVVGSHGDKAAIEPALDGAEAVFWLPPGHPSAAGPQAAYVEFTRPFAAALPSSRVTHVVGISALGRGWDKPAGHVTASLSMDDMIGDAVASYRALACASLMDNIARQIDPISEFGTFFQPTPGNLKLPHVAKSDVAQVAARLLLDRSRTGAGEVPLVGPEDMTFEEMAITMSEVLGRKVGFREISMKDFANLLRQMGTSEGMTAGYVEMIGSKNAGMDALGQAADRSLTPTTFRSWCMAELVPELEAADLRSAARSAD